MLIYKLTLYSLNISNIKSSPFEILSFLLQVHFTPLVKALLGIMYHSRPHSSHLTRTFVCESLYFSIIRILSFTVNSLLMKSSCDNFTNELILSFLQYIQPCLCSK